MCGERQGRRKGAGEPKKTKKLDGQQKTDDEFEGLGFISKGQQAMGSSTFKVSHPENIPLQEAQVK